MPVLARMLASPLFVDIRAGAVEDLADAAARALHLQHRDACWSPSGRRRARRSGTGSQPSLPERDGVRGLGRQPGRGRRAPGGARRARYDAVVGDRRWPDPRRRQVRRHPGRPARWSRSPPTSPTTASARRSPRSSTPTARARTASRCRWRWSSTSTTSAPRRPPGARRHRRRGQQPVGHRGLARWRSRERGEPVDGLALAFARTAAEAVIHRTDSIEDDDFLVALAEALVLSGMAMSVAGTSRPCSGACHEILHADRPALSPACPTTASSPGSARSSPRSCAATTPGSPRSPAACAATGWPPLPARTSG